MFVYAYIGWCDASLIRVNNQQGEASSLLKKPIQRC
jgi:hypothetical protein